MSPKTVSNEISPGSSSTQTHVFARVAASRSLGLERAILRLLPGATVLILAYRALEMLDFSPSAVSNRITEYSIALVMIPVAFVGFWITVSGFKWLAYALWPAWLGIEADTGGLTLHLGPLRGGRYTLDRLDLRYLFELMEDDAFEEETFEAFLPPEQQMATLLPRMRFPGLNEPLERRMMRVVRMSEKELATRLRPFFDHVRRDRPDPSHE